MKIKHLKYYLLLTSLFLSKVVYAANKVNEAASGGEKISNLQLKEYGVFLGALTVAIIMIAVFILIKKISDD